MDEDLKNLEALLRGITWDEPPPSLDERIRRLGEFHHAQPRKRFPRKRQLVFAASITAAVCVGFFAGRITAPSPSANSLRDLKPPSAPQANRETSEQEKRRLQEPPRISRELMLAMTAKAQRVSAPRAAALGEEASHEPPQFLLDTDAPVLEISALRYD